MMLWYLWNTAVLSVLRAEVFSHLFLNAGKPDWNVLTLEIDVRSYILLLIDIGQCSSLHVCSKSRELNKNECKQTWFKERKFKIVFSV